MRLVERKEVTKVVMDDVIVGRRCDICNKDIKKIHDNRNYNYFVIHTYHSDWGNDSIDSHEYYDACCPECVMTFARRYVEESFKRIFNSRVIEIKHVRSLEEGSNY